MSSLFKTLGWSGGSAVTTSAAPAWSLDRSLSRLEGERYLKARNYSEAEKYLALAVTEAEERSNPVLKRVRLRVQLAEAQRKQAITGVDDFDEGKLQEAESTLRTAIECAAEVSDRIGYLMCLDALAEVFADQGRFSAVEKVLQDAIRIEVELPHPDPVRMARRTHRLGVARRKAGRPEDAIPALEKALALHQELYGEQHAETADLLTELGVAYRAQETYPQAIDALRGALRIYEREHGADSPQTIRALHQLAGSLEESGDIDGAASQYERALMLKQRVIGGDMESLAEMQFGIAGLYITWGNYSRARELLTESIGTFRRRGGARLAVSYETLAHVEECSGRYHDAVKAFANAGSVWEKCNRPTELVENLKRRAELLDQLRKKSEANYLRDRASSLLGSSQAS